MRRDPVLVIGPQRTGSTLIGRLFAEADGSAATVNGKLILYLLAYLPDANFRDWSLHFRVDEIVWALRRKPVLAAKAGFSTNFEQHAAALADTLRSASANWTRHTFIAELLFRLYRTWQPEAVFWGDKYNEYALLLDDIAELYPGARFVFTRRCAEEAARSAIAAFADRSWQPHDLREATAKVADWNARIDDFRVRRPDCATMVVEYSDLVAAPGDILSDIERFAGVSGLLRQAGKIGHDRRNDTVLPESY